MQKLSITPKQQEILKLIYRYRFLNRIQIQTFLNHKNKKNINTWLKDLTDKQILGRHYTNTIKENTKPAIYYLITKSKQFLITDPDINQDILKRLYRDKKSSEKLINHSVLLADYYFHQLNLLDGRALQFITKTDLVGRDSLPSKLPDAYISIKDKNATNRCFLEIIDEGTPRFILRAKIQMYIEYFASHAWQGSTNYPFPDILLLCPNTTIKDFLQKHITRAMEQEPDIDIEYFLSTNSPILWENAIADQGQTPGE